MIHSLRITLPILPLEGLCSAIFTCNLISVHVWTITAGSLTGTLHGSAFDPSSQVSSKKNTMKSFISMSTLLWDMQVLTSWKLTSTLLYFRTSSNVCKHWTKLDRHSRLIHYNKLVAASSYQQLRTRMSRAWMNSIDRGQLRFQTLHSLRMNMHALSMGKCVQKNQIKMHVFTRYALQGNK